MEGGCGRSPDVVSMEFFLAHLTEHGRTFPPMTRIAWQGQPAGNNDRRQRIKSSSKVLSSAVKWTEAISNACCRPEALMV